MFCARLDTRQLPRQEPRRFSTDPSLDRCSTLTGTRQVTAARAHELGRPVRGGTCGMRPPAGRLPTELPTLGPRAHGTQAHVDRAVSEGSAFRREAFRAGQALQGPLGTPDPAGPGAAAGHITVRRPPARAASSAFACGPASAGTRGSGATAYRGAICAIGFARREAGNRRSAKTLNG